MKPMSHQRQYRGRTATIRYPFWFLLGLLAVSANAQNALWYITRGYSSNDDAWGVATDTSGTIYWTTTVKHPDSLYTDIFIHKIDPLGNELWQSSCCRSPFNEQDFIAVIKEPFVYLGGRTDASASGNQNLLLVACCKSGDTLVREWTYTWDQAGYYEEVDGIVVTDEAIYLAGWTSPTPLNQDIVLQRLDLSGNLIWSRVWGGTGLEGANGHMALDRNNIYIASHYGPLGRNGEALLITFDRDSGNYLWHQTWGKPDSDDAFYGLTMSQDSFLYAVGPSPMGLGIFSDLALVKYDRNGNLIWERRWGSLRHESARALIADGDSVIYVAGYTSSFGAGSADILLLKYRADGTLLNYNVWGGAADDNAHDIALAGDYLYLTGATASFGAGGKDALLIRVDKRTLQFPDTLSNLNDNRRTCLAPRLTVQPNPASGATTLVCSLPQAGAIRLQLYDITGKLVTTLINRYQPAGCCSFSLLCSQLPVGIYQLRLETRAATTTARLIVE